MPHSHTLPTPSIPHPSPRATTFYGAATIAAPLPRIWSVLLDFPSYPSWNTFTPDPHPAPAPEDVTPGLEVRFTAYLKPGDKEKGKGNKTHVQISHLQDGQDEIKTKRRLCWTSLGWMARSGALRTERVMEVEAFGDGKCEVRSFETMEGWLVGVVKGVVGGTLDEAFRRFCEEWGGEVGRRLGRGHVVNPERGVGDEVVGVGREDGKEEEDDDDDDDRR